MKKIKVSKELAMATQKALESWGEEELLRSQSSGEKWTTDVFQPLNEISLIELAEILIKGYEIEETPEDKIKKVFGNLPNSENDIFFKSGIIFCLDSYGIKIKGIND